MFEDPENYDDFFNDYMDENGLDRPDSSYLQEGCLFPGECCMPGIHYTCECHTPEMLADQFEDNGPKT